MSDEVRLNQVRDVIADALRTLTEQSAGEPLGRARHVDLMALLESARAWDARGADAPLIETLSAIAFAHGYLGSAGPNRLLSAKELSQLRTRLQNALDGLATHLGGEPRLPGL